MPERLLGLETQEGSSCPTFPILASEPCRNPKPWPQSHLASWHRRLRWLPWAESPSQLLLHCSWGPDRRRP